MENDNQHVEIAPGEISFRDIILKTREWYLHLKKKWKVLLLSLVVGGCLGLAYSFTQKPTYQAELTFILEDSKSNPLGAYAGLAAQFGFDLGGAGTGIFSGDNIIEFLRSRLMIRKSLLSPLTGNEQQSMADKYISANGFREKWEGIERLKGLRLPPNLDGKMSLLQDSILQVLHEDITKNALIVAKPDKKLSFISVKFRTRDQDLSKQFTERLVAAASEFYIQTKTQRTKVNVDKLQARADSIQALLNRKTYSAAAVQDININPIKRVATVQTELATRDKLVLQTMYTEVVKNLEISKMAMVQETPIIQMVDRPILPLKKEKFSKVKASLLGMFLGLTLIIFILILKRIYSAIMVQ